MKIPDELDDQLRKEAERRSMTVSALVREALERHLGVPRQRRMRAAGMFASDPDNTSPVAQAILDEIFTEAEDPSRGSPPSPS